MLHLTGQGADHGPSHNQSAHQYCESGNIDKQTALDEEVRHNVICRYLCLHGRVPAVSEQQHAQAHAVRVRSISTCIAFAFTQPRPTPICRLLVLSLSPCASAIHEALRQHLSP